MKYDLFFQLAKQAGIEDAELYLAESRSLSISLFHGEIDQYSDNNGYTILAINFSNIPTTIINIDIVIAKMENQFFILLDHFEHLLEFPINKRLPHFWIFNPSTQLFIHIILIIYYQSIS